VRIIAGRWKGHGLKTVKGRDVRPTTDRVREAWMSALGSDVVDARVVDLFAGSGALGLEALSRGAASAVFVERSRGALTALRSNIERLRPGPEAPRANEVGASSASAVAAAPAEKEAAPSAALAKSEPATSRSVDQLLDDALAGPSERRAQAAQPAALPEAPTREEVTQAMAVLLPAIRGCAMGQVGLATAGIVVRGDGRVASVELSGAPFEGTASGRCMEGVLRRARFSRFRQPTFRVRFPFSIQ